MHACNVTTDKSRHAGVTPNLGAVDVHVLGVVAALAAGGPVRAVHVVVLALVAALLARHRAVRQHPARVLNSAAIIRRELFLWDGKFLESGIDCERRETFFSVGKYFNGQEIFWSNRILSLERKAMYWCWKSYEDDDIMF